LKQDLRTALQGFREARGCLELLARVMGGSWDLTMSPRWRFSPRPGSGQNVVERVNTILADYPEARQRMVVALMDPSPVEVAEP
jgi:hypothetical protein